MIAATPRVSVIIACRDEVQWIGKTLRSVLRQTYGALEVIVVDDGSTDGTPKIVGKIQDPRLRLIRRKPKGACAARNVGLAAASGALIQMIDGDDLLAPDKIERQVERWRADGDDYVYFGPYATFSSSTRHALTDPKPNWTDMSGRDWLASCWAHGGMMAPHSWLTPIGLARAAGPWDETLLQNQDGDYFSRVLLASSGVRFCAEALSYYRVGVKHSISKRRDRAARLSRFTATQAMAERLIDAFSADDEADRPDNRLAFARHACAIAYEEQALVNLIEYPDIAAQALAALADFGGSDGSMPYRGNRFRKFARLFGPRAACWLQHLSGLLGSKRGLAASAHTGMPESRLPASGADRRDGTTH